MHRRRASLVECKSVIVIQYSIKLDGKKSMKIINYTQEGLHVIVVTS